MARNSKTAVISLDIRLEFRFRRREDAARFCKIVFEGSISPKKRNGAWSAAWRLKSLKCSQENKTYVRDNHKEVFDGIAKVFGGRVVSSRVC